MQASATLNVGKPRTDEVDHRTVIAPEETVREVPECAPEDEPQTAARPVTKRRAPRHRTAINHRPRTR